jgi:uncharacterized protein (DUF2235 family)
MTNPRSTERNLVLCLDGTNNEPETGATNVARIYDLAEKNAGQLVYYDPGVGTMGARGSVTRFGKAMTRVAGLVAGFGIKDNLEEAYTWLSRNYQKGDRIYVFGFSRGAYTARALTGMLRTVGLLRPGSENLVPYAVKLYTKAGPGAEAGPEAKAAEKKFWDQRDEFVRVFGNPDFPTMFNREVPQVHFLGVWDTVKTVGWLNVKARFETARWPFTRKIDNVGTARHAMAIDERRRLYAPYRFDQATVARSAGDHQEMWFAGVHSDVGGQFPDDHRLSDIALSWMVHAAERAEFRVIKQKYRWMLGVRFDEELPADHAMGRIHTNENIWRLLGFRRREIPNGDRIHPTVQYRILHSDYRPDLKR